MNKILCLALCLLVALAALPALADDTWGQEPLCFTGDVYAAYDDSAMPDGHLKIAIKFVDERPARQRQYFICDIQVKEGKPAYASTFSGIYTLHGYVEDSSVSVSMDGNTCYSMAGVIALEDFEILNSEMEVSVKSIGDVYGFSVERDFNAEDSVVEISAASYEAEEPGNVFGIACENAVFKITDPKYSVTSSAADGIAVAASLNETQEEPASYQEGYVCTNIFLRDDTSCVYPEENAVGQAGFAPTSSQISQYFLLETFYNLQNTSAPAEKVIISMKTEEEEGGGTDEVPSRRAGMSPP